MNNYETNKAWLKLLREEQRRWKHYSMLAGVGIGLFLIWLSLVMMWCMFA
jgi:hypothetical protein